MSSPEQRHKYEYQVDPAADTAPARVVRMVGAGKHVLEIGSGPGSITRLLKEVNQCRITALEIDLEAIEKVRPYCEAVHQADLNDPSWPALLSATRFEVVIAADVLEHLYHPLAALTAMKNLVRQGGCIVVSLPHVSHAAIVACLLDEDFEYRDWGLLDRTHIRFFGIKNMQSLFTQAGLKIIEAEFVIRHPDATEFAQRWSGMSELAKTAALANPFALVYQVVIKAVPLEAEGEALSLVDQIAGSPPDNSGAQPSGATTGWLPYMRRQARHHLNPETRAALRRLLARLGVSV